MDRGNVRLLYSDTGRYSARLENRGFEEWGLISINAPAGFEQRMPDIVKWFAEHPLGEVAGA
jgi:hypothetical protein